MRRDSGKWRDGRAGACTIRFVIPARFAELAVEAEAVADERQLDGRRHLELVGEDETGDTELSLGIVVTREGGIEEAELALSASSGESIALALDLEAEVADVDPLLATLSGEGVEVVIEQDEEGHFRVSVHGDEAAR